MNTRQLLVQTAQLHHQRQRAVISSQHPPPRDDHDIYLDMSDLVDEKKWDSIRDAVCNIPQKSRPYVVKHLIGRLLREKKFTEEVVSVLDYISGGCSLEQRICQILERNGSIDAMRYYLGKGAPFHLKVEDIPIPSSNVSNIVSYLMDKLPKGTTHQSVYGPSRTSLLTHVIDMHYTKDMLNDIELLFSLGADPNVQECRTGNTALIVWADAFYHRWTRYGELLPLDTLRLLLEKGANPLIKNKAGKDAVYYLRIWREQANNLPAEYRDELNEICHNLNMD